MIYTWHNNQFAYHQIIDENGLILKVKRIPMSMFVEKQFVEIERLRNLDGVESVTEEEDGNIVVVLETESSVHYPNLADILPELSKTKKVVNLDRLHRWSVASSSSSSSKQKDVYGEYNGPKTPKSRNTTCSKCGGIIPPGKSGRKCKDCRTNG